MFGSKKKKVDRRMAVSQFLAAVPHQNTAIKTEPRAEGVLVSVPVRRPGWLIPPISWVLPWSQHRRVELDAAGSEVLDMVDGRRTVEDIVETFAGNHKLTFRESQVAVTQFLRQLVQRGIVVIVGMSERRMQQPGAR
ncbi:MAG: PqqD family protein [Planctomycetota bacterium]|jgi:hypothetical protein